MSIQRQVPRHWYPAETEDDARHSVESDTRSFDVAARLATPSYPIDPTPTDTTGRTSSTVGVFESQNLLNASVSTSRTGGGGGGSVPFASPSAPSKIGIYGWRKRCLYLIILVILVVAILNLALTIWIVRVVNLTSDGFLGPLKIGSDSIHVSGDAEFLGSLRASEITAKSEDAPLLIQSARNLSFRTVDGRRRRGDGGDDDDDNAATCGSVTLTSGGRLDVAVDDFWVKNCAGATLLRARGDTDLEIGGSRSVEITSDGGAAFVDGVETSKITAPPAENVEIVSTTNRIDFFGAKGISLLAKSGGVSVHAMDDISMTSKRGKVKLDADIQMINLPIVDNDVENSPLEAYQLCVCENGRLYLTASREFCAYDSKICS